MREAEVTREAEEDRRPRHMLKHLKQVRVGRHEHHERWQGAMGMHGASTTIPVAKSEPQAREPTTASQDTYGVKRGTKSLTEAGRRQRRRKGEKETTDHGPREDP